MIFDVRLCVNDRHGNFTGRCGQVSIAHRQWTGAMIYLDSPWADRSLKCRIEKGHLILGKAEVWKVYGYATMVGNVHWDCVRMTAEDTASLLNFLVRKRYRPIEILCSLAEVLETSGEVTAADLVRVCEVQV